MEGNFKYKLEPYSGSKSRFRCPQCGKNNNFARYIDVDGNYIGEDYGRCNSEVRCAYHKTPKGNSIVSGDFKYEKPEPTFLPKAYVAGRKFKDNLYDYLIGDYKKEDVKKVFNKYNVRSINNNCRTGKIIHYNSSDGKRVKEPYSHIYWMHSALRDENFVLEQCLFGEHLLDNFDTSKGTIYLVESEKTCLIASLHYPDDLFLATGGLSNLSSRKLAVLKGYNVEAIPDKGGYDYWKKKLEPLGITVNTVMEDSDMPDGSDIADLLIN